MSSPDGTPRRGLSGLAITGIGCAVLFVMVVATAGIFIYVGVKKVRDHAREFFNDPEKTIAVANARQNHDIEVLKIDDEKREITFRDKATGEERTLSFVSAAAHKFAATDEKGAPMEDSDPTRLPAWVPQYPAAQARGGGSKRVFDGKVSGTYMARTKDAPAKVAGYYNDALKALGFETRVESSKTDGNEMNMIIAAKTEGARKVKVIAHLGHDGTYVVLSYEGAK